jgi:hypothetical protein
MSNHRDGDDTENYLWLPLVESARAPGVQGEANLFKPTKARSHYKTRCGSLIEEIIHLEKHMLSLMWSLAVMRSG